MQGTAKSALLAHHSSVALAGTSEFLLILMEGKGEGEKAKSLFNDVDDIVRSTRQLEAKY